MLICQYMCLCIYISPLNSLPLFRVHFHLKKREGICQKRVVCMYFSYMPFPPIKLFLQFHSVDFCSGYLVIFIEKTVLIRLVYLCVTPPHPQFVSNHRFIESKSQLVGLCPGFNRSLDSGTFFFYILN